MGGDGKPFQLNMARNDLAVLFAEFGFKLGVEVGVEKGVYSEILLKVNPGLSLHGIDPLLVYKNYREHIHQDEMDTFLDEILERTSGCDYTFHRSFSLDAVKEFPDESFDFVYIDANHDFQNTTNDIAEWSKKVKVGGIVSGHDYRRNKQKAFPCHVKDVVQGWTYSHSIKPWFVTAGRSASWFWVKE